ncbi:hypothetical protein C5167_020253 [Papaver somniferum]|uniref:NPR1/NIM1-like C-terminal domain-containing protein n=1 Tax=Papaver somniferum TaxID=3469 RepID=A0A4Y7IWP4_PAPSO|nr:BTB/POZ domain and ankyrin repeat-containing protein NPR1-like [Papaver somniferum]XP_026449307.1 BTB/POZ domain and ankyrin repeat-containing protein NPR1-like [Papaver somniferum]RZC51825.1 hypothetical protein C5167_020270 [Papaver somniferum]RZC51828.1 hypothetical protein C5167_020253 [Papaver somniferum]
MDENGDDLGMKLLFLENRESLARFLFPNEAQVIMGIAEVDDTLKLLPLYAMSLNETPSSVSKEEEVALIRRITTISKSVELGKRYFPRCNEVLDKIMNSDELLELAGYNSNLPEERVVKRKKFMELKEMFEMAFNQDK